MEDTRKSKSTYTSYGITRQAYVVVCMLRAVVGIGAIIMRYKLIDLGNMYTAFQPELEPFYVIANLIAWLCVIWATADSFFMNIVETVEIEERQK